MFAKKARTSSSSHGAGITNTDFHSVNSENDIKMQKFFRKIRQKLIEAGNLKRYLVYAVGEILLIMIGILLALKVNDWNERRKALNQESLYLNRLLAELRLDSLAFANEIEKNTKRNTQIANFTKLLNLSISDDSSLVVAACEYFANGWYLPHFSVSTSTFDDLSSTGQLNIIQSADLRNLLVKQYAAYEETKTRFHFNREWITSIDAGFTAQSDVLRFDPKTNQLFEVQSLENKARQLRHEKDIYIRNAAVHFWVNESSINSIDEQLIAVSRLIDLLRDALE